MGFLSNIFKSRTLKYADELYIQVKQDKEQLITENKLLREEIKELNKQLIELITNKQNNTITPNNTNSVNNNIKEKVVDIATTPQKLAKKEKFILDLIDEHKNYKKVLKLSGCKETSFKVYISRIKNKGYEINFK